MKKILIATFVCLAISSIAFSQAAKSAYFELGGPGLASFNFDTRFANAENGFGGRIGVGGFSLRSEFDNGSGTEVDRVTVIFIPIGVNYLIGKDTKNYFEVGGGVTPVIASTNQDDDDNFTTTFGWVNFGYRMQPLNSGFTFRAFITPVFGKFGFIPYYGGVSFGYKFGSKK